MEKYLNQKSFGNFYLNGTKYSGELSLIGRASSLIIRDINKVPIDSNYIHGSLYDLTRVTIAGFNRATSGSHGKRTANNYYERSLFLEISPRYLIFGDDNIIPNETAFESIEFSVTHSTRLFYDYHSFTQIVHADKDLVSNLINSDEIKSNDLYGYDISTNYRVGEYPLVFIYTGATTICEFDTSFGYLSFINAPSYTSPSPSGYSVDNKVFCKLEFKSPKTFIDAKNIIPYFIQFFQLLSGQRLAIEDFKLLKNKGAQSEVEIYHVLDCNPIDSKTDIEQSEISPIDRLISIEDNAVLFKKVLLNWISKCESWQESRWSFIESFTENIYSPDLLIKAANMFDIIPDCEYPKKANLSKELLQAKDECKRMFKSLPDSDEKKSLLGALGRIGTLTLKHKIRHRAKIIPPNNRFSIEDLNFIIGQAVDCRNHFVHGSRRKFDYYANFDMVCFFIKTLIFIYGVSDLVESGWNLNEWLKKNPVGHPFCDYIINFEISFSKLKVILDKQ